MVPIPPHRSPSTGKRPKSLPKNGESRRHSVGFCRLAPSNIAPLRTCLLLTTVLSIKLTVPRGTTIAGMRFARYLATYKIGFPGWPEPTLDSVTGFGVSIAKKGACTSPLFHFQGLLPPFEPVSLPKNWPHLSTRWRRDSQPKRNLRADARAKGSGETQSTPAFPSLTDNCQRSTVRQKNERPVGGPAARAWGWRVQ